MFPLSAGLKQTLRVASPFRVQSKIRCSSENLFVYAAVIYDCFISLVDGENKILTRIMRDSGARNTFYWKTYWVIWMRKSVNKWLTLFNPIHFFS